MLRWITKSKSRVVGEAAGAFIAVLMFLFPRWSRKLAIGIQMDFGVWFWIVTTGYAACKRHEERAIFSW